MKQYDVKISHAALSDMEQIYSYIADRLLDRQAAKLGDLQLDARIALAEATDRLGHQHPDHRRNAKPQHPFMQVVDIAQL